MTLRSGGVARPATQRRPLRFYGAVGADVPRGTEFRPFAYTVGDSVPGAHPLIAADCHTSQRWRPPAFERPGFLTRARIYASRDTEAVREWMAHMSAYLVVDNATVLECDGTPLREGVALSAAVRPGSLVDARVCVHAPAPTAAAEPPFWTEAIGASLRCRTCATAALRRGADDADYRHAIRAAYEIKALDDFARLDDGHEHAPPPGESEWVPDPRRIGVAEQAPLLVWFELTGYEEVPASS